MIKRLLNGRHADLFTGDVFGLGRHRILRISLTDSRKSTLVQFFSQWEVR